MAQVGIVPARGPWEYRTFKQSQLTTLSQGAFQKGELVGLDHGRSLSIWTSTQSSYLGVAMHGSDESRFGVTIAIPAPNCTAYVDSLTTEGASFQSLGQAGSIITRYGKTSCLSMNPGGGSVFSFQVNIVGPVDSTTSRVEVGFLAQTAIFYSASSATLNN